MHNTQDCCRYEKDGKEKANFHAAKKDGINPNPARQILAQLSKKLDKLKTQEGEQESKKRRYKDSNSNSEQGAGQGSTRKVELNFGETVKKAKVTPPYPIKATPTNIASDPDDVCTTLVSDTDDVMLTSSSQNKETHNNHSTLPRKTHQKEKSHQ